MKTILVIEDEQSIADTVAHGIQREGYTAVWCHRGLDGLERAKQNDIALIVLDVGLPDISGFELCKSIRAFSSVPIIFLTAHDDETDKIVGLEIGADDYVTKPFSPRELTVRIKAVLRRVSDPAQSSKEKACGADRLTTKLTQLAVNTDKMQALFCNQKLDLTRYEFQLLALLAAHPGQVFTRETIMDKVWGDDSPSLDRTVDAHVKSLRAKFREVDASVDPILTHRGMGYALRDDV